MKVTPGVAEQPVCSRAGARGRCFRDAGWTDTGHVPRPPHALGPLGAGAALGAVQAELCSVNKAGRSRPGCAKRPRLPPRLRAVLSLPSPLSFSAHGTALPHILGPVPSAPPLSLAVRSLPVCLAAPERLCPPQTPCCLPGTVALTGTVLPARVTDMLSKEPPWCDGSTCYECAAKFGVTTRKHHW